MSSAISLDKTVNCSICLETILQNQENIANDEVLATTCAHLFHESCLIPWLKLNSNCPNCKTPQNPNPYWAPLEQRNVEHLVHQTISPEVMAHLGRIGLLRADGGIDYEAIERRDQHAESAYREAEARHQAARALANSVNEDQRPVRNFGADDEEDDLIYK